MKRAWLVAQLKTVTEVINLAGSRVFSATSVIDPPSTKPFLMYRSLANVPRLSGDDQAVARSESFLVFVHDTPGDYLRIDAIIDGIVTKFNGVAGDSNTRAEWSEISEEFRDIDLGTIMRYVRVRLTYT